MAGTTELFKRLDSEGEPLVKRLCLAQNVFQSSQLPLQRKEESVINWLCLVAEKFKEKKRRKSISSLPDDVAKLWSTMQFCLSNSRLGVAEVRPSTKLNIVEVLSKHLGRDNLSNTELLPVLECALCVLGAKSFQVYFCSNILVCMKFVSCVLRRLSDIGPDHAALSLRGVTSIQTISKQTILRNDLRITFLDVVLLPLIKLLKFGGHEGSPLPAKINICIEQILFSKTSSDFSQFFAGLFKENQDVANQSGSENQFSVPLRLISVLKEARNLLDNDLFVSLFTMVFRAFVQSFPKDTEPLVFEAVVTLSYLVGFEVKSPKCKVPYSKLEEICSEFRWELDALSFSVLHGVVHFLARSPTISSSKEINGTRFSNWLQMLLESFFPLPSTLAAAPFMKLISALLKLNPMVVKPNVKNILRAIMAKPLLDEDKPTYSTLISEILSLHLKLSHIPYFFKDFLASVSDGFNKQQECGDAPPDHNTWLPPTVIQELIECATGMPSASSIAALKVLLHELSENRLKPYQQALEQSLPPPNGFMDVQIYIVCELMCSIIKGVRMLESCATAHARQEFCSIINQLRQQLISFGEFLLKVKKPNSVMVSSFLNVSHHWAAQAILIEQYADVGREELLKSVQIDLRAECQTASGVGIYSYMHPYLSSQQWESVYETIINIEGDDCKKYLLELELQLLSALIMFNSSQSTLIKEVAKRAYDLMVQKLNTVDSVPIDRNTASSIVLLAPLISVSELSILSNGLAVNLIADSNKSSLGDVLSLLVEERLTAAGLICSVLSNLRRSLKVSKRKRDEAGGKLWKTSKAVLGKLDAETIIQEEIRGRSNTSEQLSSVLSSMASHLADVLLAVDGGQWQISGEEYDFTNLSQHLHFLQSLPLAYFTSGTRAVIFMSLISVALDCSLLATSQMKDSILKQIFDHLLLGLYEMKKHHGPSLNGYLDHGILISTLAYFVTNFNVGGGLLELLLEQALRQEHPQEQVIKKILLLRKENCKNKPSQESWLLGTLLMKVSSGMKFKSHSGKPSNNADVSTYEPFNKLIKARKKMVKSFEALLQHELVSTEEGLQAFALALDFNVNADRNLNNLIPSFEKFCVSAVSSLNCGRIPEQKAAEAFILTVCRYRKKLSEAVPDTFIKDVWSHLASSVKPNEALLTATIQSATEEETSFIMNDLLSKTQKAYNTCGIENGVPENISSNIIEIWQLLLRKQNSSNKYVVVGLRALRDLFGLLIVGKLSHLKLLDFLNTVLSSTLITVDIHIVDFCFLVLHEVNLPHSTNEFIPVARQYLSVLSALFHHQSSLALDCIPSFMQMLQHLVKQLANESRQRSELSHSDGAELALIAFGLEKLVTIFTKPNMKRSFQKIAAYFLADIISVFETITLCQSVKVHFENMVYAILSILDDHAIKFLLRILSSASTEIFKNLQQAYKKFHSFTGKV